MLKNRLRRHLLVVYQMILHDVLLLISRYRAGSGLLQYRGSSREEEAIRYYAHESSCVGFLQDQSTIGTRWLSVGFSLTHDSRHRDFHRFGSVWSFVDPMVYRP